MSTAPVCSNCGLPLSDGVAEGLCPACLLGIALAGGGDLGATTTGTVAAPMPVPGLGRYHSIGVLGEGGMGIVYLAEQLEPVRRRVALKVLKGAGDEASFIARFKSESQALAIMDHPNIARVYDAGATVDGRPYFAMEYVPGVPITDYCDRNLLGFGERLALFQLVCHAVQHAHQKGIIHRDLKPSNVLVMLQDGKPVPKVIDFGVSRAVNQHLMERQAFTEFGMMIGTPEYMSPEQANLTGGVDIDTTTDVYSLGVLLYELLVGALPFDSAMLRRAGYAEIQRVIREQEPPKLTTRLSGMGRPAVEVAKARRTDVAALMRLLRGDLEWITMKALEKERSRRYASASEFAADIGRHLANEPVAAAAPSLAYRARKFVRRNRGLVTAVAAVVLVSVIGAAVSFLHYRQAEAAREKAELESYSANLNAAQLQLGAGRVPEARAMLAKTSRNLRGWEWRHLMTRSDRSSATFYARDLFPVVDVVDHSLRVNADGTRLFYAEGAAMRSWDLETKRPGADLAGLGRLLAIGPLGKTILVTDQLAAAADPPKDGFGMKLYDVATRRVLVTFPPMATFPGYAAISDDGTLVAVHMPYYSTYPTQPPEHQPILLYDGHTGTARGRLLDNRRAIQYPISVSPDGRFLASPAYHPALYVWNVNKPLQPVVLRHDRPLMACEFSQDGKLLATSTWDDGMISIWEPSSGRLLRRWKAAGDSGIVRALAFSPDSSLLATSILGAVGVWEVKSGDSVAEFLTPDDVSDKLAFHPHEPRLFAAGSGIVKEWDLRRVDTLADAKGRVRGVAVSHDGRLFATTSTEGAIKIYDARTRKLVTTIMDVGERFNLVSFSPDASLLAAISLGNTVKLWKVSDGQLFRTLRGHSEIVRSIAFSPDGSQIVSGSRDRTIRIWSLKSDEPAGVISTDSPLCSVAVSPDGKTFAALRASDLAIELRDTNSRRQTAVLKSESNGFSVYCDMSPLPGVFSPDGALLAGPAENGTSVAIWDVPRRRVLRVLPVSSSHSISFAAISPDSSRIAFGSLFTPNVFIWDLRKGTELLTLSGHTAQVYGLVWTPDGNTLLSASADRTVRLWDALPGTRFEAELLVEGLSRKLLLADEVVQALNSDSSIPPDVKTEAIRIAQERGNGYASELVDDSRTKAGNAGLTGAQYAQALRRITVAAGIGPGNAIVQLVAGLTAYRAGSYPIAIASASKAVELKKSTAAEAHSILAMAYYRMNDRRRAQAEIGLARQPLARTGPDDEPVFAGIVAEAEGLLSGKTQ